MKISNAIKNVESIFSNSPDIVSDEDNESVEFALEAMEKQDPIKPIEEDKEFRCGMCNTSVAKYDGYCWNCGQKLDWED